MNDLTGSRTDRQDVGSAGLPPRMAAANGTTRPARQRGGRIFFCAGEHSGDVHGALVLQHLLQERPDLTAEGIGGPLMQAAGLRCLHSIDELAVIGFVEVVKNLPRLWSILRDVQRHFERNRPDVVVLIDYPGFNMRVAEMARRLGIHVVYYICPQVWAWHSGRVHKISQTINEAVVVFPFEVEIWKKAGAEVNWFGHPLVGLARPRVPRDEFRREAGCETGPVVALLPGSRTQEIYYILPALLDTAELILRERPQARFLLPVAGTIPDALVLPHLRGRNLPLTMLRGQTYDAINASDLALVASGTATLETAIIGTPMIVVYQTNWFTSFISKLVIQMPHIGLPNVLAGEQIVPEFLRWNFKPRLVAEEALRILDHPERQADMRRRLADVRARLGEPGAAERVAHHLAGRLSEVVRP
jgi:lipid-A-disaccharide synthase